MSETEQRTALAGRNRIECEECEEEIDGKHELKRTVRWGFWDAEAQNFRDAARQEHYCQSCWSRKFKREAAAYYELTDADRFWNILEAADGDLVADLSSMFVGSSSWIRIVDGDLQAMRSTTEARTEGDQRIIEFDVEAVPLGKPWFEKVFRDDRNLPDDDYPTLALLKPADETPFAEWEELPEDQSTLDEHCAVPREGGSE